MKTQKITPNLWFDNQAEEAADLYISVFENSGKGRLSRYGKEGFEIHKQPEGKVMTVEFWLENFQFVGLNGGPMFQINPSISFFIICKTEREAEVYWEKLVKGGEILMPLDNYEWSPKYGWLQDKFGVNWQIMLEKPSTTKQKIIPSLFFTGEKHGKAEEAIKFYTSVFKNSEIEGILKYDENDGNNYALGSVKHAQFKLEGQTFMAMDSGIENDFPFSEGISFVIECENQEEIDYYWEKLTSGGDPAAQQCGWLKDQFGVSWQVVPSILSKMLQDPDKQKTERVTKAFLQMKKFNIRDLEKAYHKDEKKLI